jgi:chromate transport protein ChrA
VHILKLFAIASFIAAAYSIYHKKSYKSIISEYSLNLIGIVGTSLWYMFGNALEFQVYLILFCKIIFFALTYDVIFETAKWIFLALIFLTYSFLSLTFVNNQMVVLAYEIILILIVALKLYELSTDK